MDRARPRKRSANSPRAPRRPARLRDIEQYAASRFLFLRFNYTSGDAAGQNVTGEAATAAACGMVQGLSRTGKFRHFQLEANLATDKKASQVNTLNTRGEARRGGG